MVESWGLVIFSFKGRPELGTDVLRVGKGGIGNCRLGEKDL